MRRSIHTPAPATSSAPGTEMPVICAALSVVRPPAADRTAVRPPGGAEAAAFPFLSPAPAAPAAFPGLPALPARLPGVPAADGGSAAGTRTGTVAATEPSAPSSTARCCGLAKSNMPASEPASASNESPPILPVPQLSSMNRRIDDWSVSVWST